MQKIKINLKDAFAKLHDKDKPITRNPIQIQKFSYINHSFQLTQKLKKKSVPIRQQKTVRITKNSNISDKHHTSFQQKDLIRSKIKNEKIKCYDRNTKSQLQSRNISKSRNSVASHVSSTEELINKYSNNLKIGNTIQLTKETNKNKGKLNITHLKNILITEPSQSYNYSNKQLLKKQKNISTEIHPFEQTKYNIESYPQKENLRFYQNIDLSNNKESLECTFKPSKLVNFSENQSKRKHMRCNTQMNNENSNSKIIDQYYSKLNQNKQKNQRKQYVSEIYEKNNDLKCSKMKKFVNLTDLMKLETNPYDNNQKMSKIVYNQNNDIQKLKKKKITFGEIQYQKAIKQLQQKILSLDI